MVNNGWDRAKRWSSSGLFWARRRSHPARCVPLAVQDPEPTPLPHSIILPRFSVHFSSVCVCDYCGSEQNHTESTHQITSKMSTYEKELLLEDDRDDASSGVASHYEVSNYVKPTSSRQWWIWAVLVQVVLVTIYTAVSYAVIRHNAGPESDADIHGKSISPRISQRCPVI
jgi:hypothetical protein